MVIAVTPHLSVVARLSVAVLGPVLMLGGLAPAAVSSAGPAAALARAPASDDDARFEWPLHPEPPVVRPFEAPEDPYGPGHRGLDLDASPGQPVLAAGAGVVVFAGQIAGRGVVSIDHDALRTTYEPVRPSVTVGDQVYAGQRIGTVVAGHADCAGTCLHWGVRRGIPPEYLNPLELVGERSQIRLKPWKEVRPMPAP